MTGRPDSEFKNQKIIIDFKYFKKSERSHFDKLIAADEKDAIQVKRYASDTRAQFPQYKLDTAVLYVCANETFKYFEV